MMVVYNSYIIDEVKWRSLTLEQRNSSINFQSVFQNVQLNGLDLVTAKKEVICKRSGHFQNQIPHSFCTIFLQQPNGSSSTSPKM